MRSASLGHAVFAAALIALGIQGLVRHDFAAIWDPVPRDLPGREALAWLGSLACLGCGLGLLWHRTAPAAARVLLAALLLWLLAFKLTAAVRAPAEAASWESCGETLVLVAAAWLLALSAGAHGMLGVRTAQALYGLALIPFGIAHFAYLRDTAALVPGFLPGHVAWAVLTGCTYLLAGAAILSGVAARLAATLSAGQMGLFTLLVWVPVVAAGSARAFQWNETAISLALTAAGWVVADSYRGQAWVGAGQNR